MASRSCILRCATHLVFSASGRPGVSRNVCMDSSQYGNRGNGPEQSPRWCAYGSLHLSGSATEHQYLEYPQSGLLTQSGPHGLQKGWCKWVLHEFSLHSQAGFFGRMPFGPCTEFSPPPHSFASINLHFFDDSSRQGSDARHSGGKSFLCPFRQSKSVSESCTCSQSFSADKAQGCFARQALEMFGGFFAIHSRLHFSPWWQTRKTEVHWCFNSPSHSSGNG